MNFFNQSITRNVIVSLMDFFSRFSIEKFQTQSVSGEFVFVQRKVIPVPIQYATREKWVEIVRSSSARKMMDTGANTSTVEMQWILPRISCNLNGIVYDANRRLAKTQKVDDFPNNLTDVNSKSAVYSPAPYNLDIEIATISRNIDENLQLMEQIIPFFAPTMSMTLFLYDGKESESVPVTLNSISMDNPIDIPENDERLFTNVYHFTVKLNYYMLKSILNRIKSMSVMMTNGQEVIQLDKKYIDALNVTQSKFNQYTANSTMVNPLTNIQTMSGATTSNGIVILGNSPTVSATQHEPEHTITLSFSNIPLIATASGGEYMDSNGIAFVMYYRKDDEIQPHKYDGTPIPITFTKLTYWINFGINPIDNTSLELLEYVVI